MNINIQISGTYNNQEETEKSILEYIISGNDGSKDIVSTLDAGDFPKETHKLIFGAIKRLHGRGVPVDVLNIYCELEDTPRPDGGDWGSYLTNVLPTALPIVAENLGFHISKIKKASYLRKVSEICCRINEAAILGESEILQNLIESLNKAQLDNVVNNCLKPISAKDLPDIPPPESLWAGLIYPGCITQLNAEPGAGKSTLVYNIAANGAQGKDFLCIPFPKPLKTLYIDLESQTWLQKQKIENICGELPVNFHLLNDFNLKQDLNDLIKLAKAENYDLIVFDTQSKALDMEDENDNSEAIRIAILLRKLANETGAAILLIHHTKKGDGGKKVHKGRGASAIAGDVDIVANLETLDSDTLKLEIVKSRIVGVYQSINMKKLGDDKFERVSTVVSLRGPELHHAQECILKLLGDGEEYRAAEILERVMLEGFKKRTVENALSKLTEAGRVQKPQYGVYFLAGHIMNGSQSNAQDKKYDITKEFG